MGKICLPSSLLAYFSLLAIIHFFHNRLLGILRFLR